MVWLQCMSHAGGHSSGKCKICIFPSNINLCVGTGIRFKVKLPIGTPTDHHDFTSERSCILCYGYKNSIKKCQSFVPLAHRYYIGPQRGKNIKM